MRLRPALARIAQRLGGSPLAAIELPADVVRVMSGRPPAPIQQRAGEPVDTQWSRYLFIDDTTLAGKTVTVERSLTIDSVFAAVRLVAEGGGSLPLRTYQRTRGGRGRFELWSEPVYRMLQDEPNREMTGIDLWSLVLVHLLTWGNAFLGKSMTGARVTELWPMAPDRMVVSREGGRKVYRLRREDGTEVRYGPEEVIHIRGLSLDGLTGLSPISYARETMGGALALDEHANRVFSSGASLRGVLEVDRELSEEAAQRLADRWRATYSGSANANRTAVLEGGVRFNPISMPLKDAQFVEQERFSVQKIARIFGVPPEMIGGESGASLTYSTVEGQSTWFHRHSLRPWLVRIEQSLNRDRDLFPGPTRGSFCEFDAQAILRAELHARYQAYEIGLRAGFLEVDECRAWENLPPMRSAPVDTPEARARQIVSAVLSNGNGQHADREEVTR